MAKANHIIPSFTDREIVKFWAKITISPPDKCWIWKGPTDTDGYGQVNLPRQQNKTFRAHRIAYFLYYGKQPGELCVCHNCPGGDNPLCCNPNHLWLGTNAENMTDRDKKGRTAKGERSGRKQHPEKYPIGAAHWTRQHPENLPRGDNHWMRKYPEKIPRGDKSTFRKHPEIIKRGDEHHFRIHPESRPTGTKNGSAKLNEIQVRAIREAYYNGTTTYDKLAQQYRVGKSTISRIIKGTHWRHII